MTDGARTRDLLLSHDPRDSCFRVLLDVAELQAAEEFAVQSLPHSCTLPLPQPPPSGHPGQPICWGTTIRHGTPVISTNMIAVNVARSLTLGRPVRCGMR